MGGLKAASNTKKEKMNYSSHSSNSQERAKALLIHYFGVLFKKAQLVWNEDNESEIASIIDNISEADIVVGQQTKATICQLNHVIRIKIDNPEIGNEINISIEPSKSSQEEERMFYSYQFTAESPDPNQWLFEAIESANLMLAGRRIKFSKPELEIEKEPIETCDLFEF